MAEDWLRQAIVEFKGAVLLDVRDKLLDLRAQCRRGHISAEAGVEHTEDVAKALDLAAARALEAVKEVWHQQPAAEEKRSAK